MTRVILFVVLALSAALAHAAAVADSAEAEAAALLQLREEQAEAIQSLDTVIENTVEAGGKARMVRTRLAFDKARGRAVVQSLDDNGAVRGQLLVLGTDVYARTPDGKDVRLPLDPQTRETLKGMGIDTEALHGGLLGEETGSAEDAQLAVEAVQSGELGSLTPQPSPVPAAAPPAAQVGAAAVKKGKPARGERLERLRQRAARRVAKAKGGLRIRRERQREKGTATVLVSRPGRELKARPFALAVESVDPGSGIVLEKRVYAAAADLDDAVQKAERRHGRPKAPAAKALAEARKARRSAERDEDGRDLVEVVHGRALKVGRYKGLSVVEESETISTGVDGSVRVHSRWKRVKVNEALPEDLFEVAQ